MCHDGWVDDVLGEQEGLVGPLDFIEVVSVLVGDVVLVLQGLSESRELVPFVVSEWLYVVIGQKLEINKTKRANNKLR